MLKLLRSSTSFSQAGSPARTKSHRLVTLTTLSLKLPVQEDPKKIEAEYVASMKVLKRIKTYGMLLTKLEANECKNFSKMLILLRHQNPRGYHGQIRCQTRQRNCKRYHCSPVPRRVPKSLAGMILMKNC